MRLSFRLPLIAALCGATSCALAQSAARVQAIELVKEAAQDFGRGELALTIKICRQALTLDPTYPRAYTYLGAAYQRRGERQNACAAFSRAVKLAPGTPDATRALRGLKELGCAAARPGANSPRLTLVPRANLRLEARWNATAGISSLAFSPDGSQISGGGSDGAWRLWRSLDGRLDRLERGAGYEASATASGPNFTAVGYGNGALRFFDARDGRDAGRIEAKNGAIASLSYAPDGALLAAAGAGALQIFDGRTNALFTRIPGDGLAVVGAAFSPDGRFVAAGVGSTVRIYEARNGRQIRVLPGDGLPIAALAWSKTGLLAGASGYKIRVWSGATGRLERTLSGHRLAVSALAFGSGNTLASGGYDAQLRLWNAATGTSTGFALHATQIRALSFDGSGQRLASADQSGLVGVWRVF